jgi:hypothetical protein
MDKDAKNIEKIRIYTLEKALNNKNAIVEKRIKRLKVYADNNHKLESRVKEAIDLTSACDIAAEQLLKLENSCSDLINSNTEDIVSRAITNYVKIISQQKGADPYSEVYLKAYQFLKKIGSDEYTDSDMTLTERLAHYLEDEDPIEAVNIQTVVAILVTDFENQKTTIDTLETAVNLSYLRRGILYAGILDYYGSSLDRKEKKDALLNLAIDTFTSSVPGLSVVLQIGDLYKTFFDMESPPAEVEAAQSVLEYLDTYISLLYGWYNMIGDIINLIVSCIKSIHGVSLNTEEPEQLGTDNVY